MNNIVFTPEFIEEQRKLGIDATKRPWEGKYFGDIIFERTTLATFYTNVDHGIIGDINRKYAVTAANNYLAALDEIEQLQRQVEANVENIAKKDDDIKKSVAWIVALSEQVDAGKMLYEVLRGDEWIYMTHLGDEGESILDDNGEEIVKSQCPCCFGIKPNHKPDCGRYKALIAWDEAAEEMAKE